MATTGSTKLLMDLPSDVLFKVLALLEPRDLGMFGLASTRCQVTAPASLLLVAGCLHATQGVCRSVASEPDAVRKSQLLLAAYLLCQALLQGLVLDDEAVWKRRCLAFNVATLQGWKVQTYRHLYCTLLHKYGHLQGK